MTEEDVRSLKRFGLLSVTIFAIVYSLVTTGAPWSILAQMTAFPHQTSQAFLEPSESPVHPLFRSGIQEQGAAQAQQQQQYSVYESPQDGFSVEYPSDWRVQEGGRAGVVVDISSSIEANFDPFAANFAIGVENLTSGTSLDNYTRSVLSLLQSQPPGANFNLTGNPSPTTFGGLPAQRLEFTMIIPSGRGINAETILQGVQVWTLDNEKAYVLSFVAEQNKLVSYLPIMEHVIDSFRIIRTSG